MGKKKENYIHHAKKRFKQRLKMSLNKNVQAKIIKGIKHCRYEFVSARISGRQVFRVTDVGKYTFDVVYDPIEDVLVTVLYV